MPKGYSGTGFVSKVPTPRHQFFKWGQWWSSEQAWDEYRRHSNERRRGATVGYYACQTPEFLEMEKQALDLLNKRKSHDERVKRAMAAIRKKYNMDRHTNRHHFRLLYEKTGDKDVKALLELISTAPLNDTQKLERIRQLFLDKRSPADILYSTALIVGLNLRKTE